MIKLNKKKFTQYLPQSFLALLMVLLIGCSAEEHYTTVTNDTSSDKALFSFAHGKLDKLPVEVSALRGGTINTGARDKVNQIRVIVPEKNHNVVFSTQGNTNPTYLYEDLKAGETCTFYFIANDNGDRSYSDAYTSDEAEALTQYTLPYFTKDNPPENNVMTSKYEVKRVGDSYQYRRVYPKPDNDFRADLTENNGVYGIPIWLYPTYSRFNISIQWPTDPDFTKENNGQEIHFDFIDFPTEMKIFGGTKDFSGTDVRTVSIDLAADFKKENLSYSFFFPATSTATEKVHLRYSFDGTEHTVLVEPKETEEFDLNTKYILPIKVFVNLEYDVWIEDLYTIEKTTLDKPSHHVADYKINPEGKKADIRMGVPHKYRTVVRTKSRLAPAEFKKTPDDHWIKLGNEISREIKFENDIPYYYQEYVIEYDVDNEQQQKPLLSQFVAVNTKDESKTASLEASFNVLARWAKMDLGELNTFINGSSDENNMADDDPLKMGYIYQFGRNVAFQGIGTSIKTERVMLNSDDYFTNNFAYGNSYYNIVVNGKTYNSAIWYDWDTTDPKQKAHKDKFDKGELPNKNWVDFIEFQKQVHGGSLPASYYGNNNGDPCPPNYRLPSASDFSSIFYNTRIPEIYVNTSSIYTFKKGIHMRSDYVGIDEHGINPSGDPSVLPRTFKADYKRMDPPPSGFQNLVYAVRMKGTRYATAFKYENHTNGSAIIYAAILREGEDINTIANEEYWSKPENKRLIVSRTFNGQLCSTSVSTMTPSIIKYPDYLTATPVEYGLVFDIDIDFSTYQRVFAVHRNLKPIRCMRD